MGTLNLTSSNPGVPMVQLPQDPFFTHCTQLFRASDATTFDEFKKIAEEQVAGFLQRDDVSTHPSLFFGVAAGRVDIIVTYSIL